MKITRILLFIIDKKSRHSTKKDENEEEKKTLEYFDYSLWCGKRINTIRK